MKYSDNLVTAADTRAEGAGTPGKCYYCAGVLGGPHEATCVCLDRPVKIRVTLDLIVDVPRAWTPAQIEAHRNGGGWCLDNVVDEIDRHIGNGRCLCSRGKVEYMGEATIEEAAEVEPESNSSGPR